MTDKEEMEEVHDSLSLHEEQGSGEEDEASAIPAFVTRHEDNLEQSEEYLESLRKADSTPLTPFEIMRNKMIRIHHLNGRKLHDEIASVRRMQHPKKLAAFLANPDASTGEDILRLQLSVAEGYGIPSTKYATNTQIRFVFRFLQDDLPEAIANVRLASKTDEQVRVLYARYRENMQRLTMVMSREKLLDPWVGPKSGLPPPRPDPRYNSPPEKKRPRPSSFDDMFDKHHQENEEGAGQVKERKILTPAERIQRNEELKILRKEKMAATLKRITDAQREHEASSSVRELPTEKEQRLLPVEIKREQLIERLTQVKGSLQNEDDVSDVLDHMTSSSTTDLAGDDTDMQVPTRETELDQRETASTGVEAVTLLTESSTSAARAQGLTIDLQRSATQNPTMESSSASMESLGKTPTFDPAQRELTKVTETETENLAQSTTSAAPESDQKTTPFGSFLENETTESSSANVGRIILPQPSNPAQRERLQATNAENYFENPTVSLRGEGGGFPPVICTPDHAKRYTWD